MDYSGSDVNVARSVIRIRGYGGLGTTDERRMAYQGFNDGTGYPQKRRENYIYEGWTAPLSSPFDFHAALWMAGWRAGHRRLPRERPGAVSTGQRNTFAILEVCGGEVGAAGHARRVIYANLAATRQRMNHVYHVEPTGEENSAMSNPQAGPHISTVIKPYKLARTDSASALWNRAGRRT